MTSATRLSLSRKDAILQKFKSEYRMCTVNKRYGAREFHSPKGTSMIQQMQMMLRGSTDVMNDEQFIQVYTAVLGDMFKYGAKNLVETMMQHKIMFFYPGELRINDSDTCRNAVSDASVWRCAHLMEYILGVDVPEDMAAVYFPKGRRPREALLRKLIAIYQDNRMHPYSNCAEFVQGAYYMYVKKLIFDTKLKNVDFAKFIQRASLVIKEFRRLVDYEDISPEHKEAAYHVIDHIRFHSVGHPIFLDVNFNKYFSEPHFHIFSDRDRLMNNDLPVVKYCVDMKQKNLFTHNLGDAATFIREGSYIYIGTGMTSLLPPFFSESYPPYFLFSGFVLDLFGEYMAQIVHQTYIKYVTLHGIGDPIDEELNNKYTHEQLFFINAAQIIVLNRMRLNDKNVYNPADATWNIFKCSRGFSNAFQCKEGDNYFKKTDEGSECYVLKGGYNANYSLDYYGPN
ncbi:unnamed protein product [Bursaphelenchus okinawaensis]|uniref:Uncharacterized protein n=1 Tax=Bursaphelenchus okinawaensis TaxID=465554 RepID=A0A811KBF9_9BILA|nr:unnamed protein product [Bursaphelenchus okinawaensis]CAG9095426.1 unnamed protein product [Bursaphelenchus okinawaensis]